MQAEMITAFWVTVVFATNPVFIGMAIDYSGVASVLAAITAGIAMYLGHRTSRQSQANVDKTTYVDTNLKVMQANIEYLQADNARLRASEERLEEELLEVREELEQCQKLCRKLSLRFDSEGGSSGRQSR